MKTSPSCRSPRSFPAALKSRHMLVTTVLAMASAASTASSLGPIDLSSGSGSFANTPVAGIFVDTLTFTLASTSLLSGSLSTVVNGAQNVDFSSVVVSGPGGSFGFVRLLSDPVEVWATSNAGFVLAPGNYTLTLTGLNSPGISSYAGVLAVTPVPEPQALLLMLAGLAATGATVCKRRTA